MKKFDLKMMEKNLWTTYCQKKVSMNNSFKTIFKKKHFHEEKKDCFIFMSDKLLT